MSDVKSILDYAESSSFWIMLTIFFHENVQKKKKKEYRSSVFEKICKVLLLFPYYTSMCYLVQMFSNKDARKYCSTCSKLIIKEIE